MAPDEVVVRLMAEPRFAVMIDAKEGSYAMDGGRVKLSSCCASKLAKLTHYAKTALPVRDTYMFKERSTGKFVSLLDLN